MYKTNKGLDKVIDCCIENKNKTRKDKVQDTGICGFVGATILGYMTANNMTKAEHD